MKSRKIPLWSIIRLIKFDRYEVLSQGKLHKFSLTKGKPNMMYVWNANARDDFEFWCSKKGWVAVKEGKRNG